MNENIDKLVSFSRDVLSDKIKIDSQELSDKLAEVVRFHEWRYYTLNEPILSDTEYDFLFKALEAIESAHPEWRSDHSPTQRVGLEITENAKQIDHLQPMLSLANSYNEKDLVDFDLQIKKLLKLDVTEEISYSVEPKYDGGGISLVYEGNQLLRAVTRGDGSRGEEITNNVKSMKSVPLYADFAKLGIKTIELRGEALISTANFTKINKLREENGQVLFANARNAATGGLRTKDPKETENRMMDAFIYSISYAADEAGNSKLDDFKSHFASIDIIGSLGVKVPSEARKLCKGIDEVVKFCAKWQNDRNLFPYEIDGMVIKLDNKNWQDRIGFTAHHPRWAIAYKFQAKQGATRLIDVEYQIGKIGSVTPVGKLEPVALAGVTISSVSLHNEEFIESRDLRLGDMVVVERAGDVIPYIVKALDDVRTGSEIPIKFPTHCPSCNSELVKLETEAAWRCINPDCPAQNLQKLIFFASKDAMDIDGFGKSIMEKFFELGWVKSYPDIYRLTEEQISGLEGFGARSAEKLIAAIKVSKANPIQRFLHALSIHHVGKKVSKLLAEEIENVLDLASWTKEHFEGIKDIGPVVAQNVIAYFGDESNVNMIKEMETLGVNLTATAKDRRAVVTNSDHHLSGKTILFTGTLHQMGSKEAQEKAESLGAKNLGAVSSNLNILVVGDNAGSKLKKAKELGTVEVLTEQEFLDLL
ncbi:NAD-dependent DNA ligase LigA [Candidatus Brachybacter algidus]|uniref:NAD-dependent DNA ligase LigA n=1 Tax=Candidatus Brachybacter algidus TaxID=2982024 RepID=UPI001DF4DA34|nr:NAD-dependent DNA ligase LigA [Candidatus Brachybacter algidus]MBK6448173.1 NAD-dependent DNA ligase LigA [Candidatus Brachybacter algidus]